MLKDVKEKKYSIKEATELFGVCINEKDFEIDQEETKILRKNKKLI